MYAVVPKHFEDNVKLLQVMVKPVFVLCVANLKVDRDADNNIGLGTWVMVGIRDWEVRGDGKTKCDLLYVYSDLDKDDIRQNSGINLELDKVNTDINGVVVDDDVVFKEDNSENYIVDQPDIVDSEEDENNQNIVDDANDNHMEKKENTPTVGGDKYEFDIDEI